MVVMIKMLGNDSCHQISIHRSWPKMMLRKVELRCLNVDPGPHVQFLVERLIKGGVSPKLIQECEVARVQKPRTRKLVDDPLQTAWLPVPFHPCWANALGRVLRQFSKNADFACLLSMSHSQWGSLAVKAAWSNVLPSISCHVNTIGRRKGSGLVD